MIDSRDIEETLELLEDKYNQARNNQDSKLLSKLALMEYCGWIEESLDQIALLIEKKLNTETFKDILQDIARRNYGFDYEKNFRVMMIQAIGLCDMETIENRVPEFVILKSELGNYKQKRDKVAHSHITKGTTLYFEAPSTVKGSLTKVLPIMQKIYTQVESIDNRG